MSYFIKRSFQCYAIPLVDLNRFRALRHFRDRGPFFSALILQLGTIYCLGFADDLFVQVHNHLFTAIMQIYCSLANKIKEYDRAHQFALTSLERQNCATLQDFEIFASDRSCFVSIVVESETAAALKTLTWIRHPVLKDTHLLC